MVLPLSINDSDLSEHLEYIKGLGRRYADLILSKSSFELHPFISHLMGTFMNYFNHSRFSSIAKPYQVFQFEQCELLDIFRTHNGSVEEFQSNCQKLYFISSAFDFAICEYPDNDIPVEAIIECLNTAVVICISESFPKKTDSRLIILDNVFEILETLLRCCGPNLKKFAPLINHMVMSIIEWLKPDQSKTLMEIRCLTYEFLSEYFRTFKQNTALSKDSFSMLLLKNLLEDLKIGGATVKISKGGLNQPSPPPTSDDCGLQEDLERLTTIAAECMNSMIRYSPNVLDESGYWKIQITVIPILMEIYFKSWYNNLHQYNNVKCRQELLKTLYVFILNVDNCPDVPLETITAILAEVQQLEDCKTIDEIVTDTSKLLNMILLSRLPIRNVRITHETFQIETDSEAEPSEDLDKTENETEEKLSGKRKFENDDDAIEEVKKQPKVVDAKPNGLDENPNIITTAIQKVSRETEAENHPRPRQNSNDSRQIEILETEIELPVIQPSVSFWTEQDKQEEGKRMDSPPTQTKDENIENILKFFHDE